MRKEYCHQAIKGIKSNHDRFKYLTDLDYADDIALIGTLLKDPQDRLSFLEDATANVGLFLNSKKTEYMTVMRKQIILKSFR